MSLSRTLVLATAATLGLPALAGFPGVSRAQVFAVAAQQQSEAVQEIRVRRALEAAVAATPTQADPYLQLARFELRMDDMDQAERVLRTGLTEASRDPAVAALRSALVEVLAARRDWDGAILVLDSAPEGEMEGAGVASARTTLARLLVNAGLDARDSGRVETALERLTRATRVDPTLRRAWLELAGVQLTRGRTEDARAAAEAGLGYHPGDPELRLLRASTLAPRESATEMVAALRELRARRPDDTGVALSLAGYLAGTGELAGALALQDTLLAAPSPDPSVFRHVATFWLENRQPDTARVILERGITGNPEADDLRVLQGRALELLGRPAEAATAYGLAAERVDEPAWLRLRAASVLAAADLNEAAAPYLQPFTRQTTPLVAGLLAVEVAWEADDPDGSAWILRQLSLDYPGNPWVQEAEARHLARLAGADAARESWLRLAGEGSPVAAVALGASVRAELEPEVLSAAVRGGLERLSRGEQGVASRGATRAVDADALATGRDLEEAWVMDRITADREAVADLLDQMVFRTDWGPAELARLRDIYPASALLARLDTRLALRQGRLDRARREVERLLDLRPRDAEVHGLHGEILEAQDRADAARSSYARALEIDAAAPGVFQALTRLHGESGTLEALLERVRRLRTLSPRDSLRVAHEVELLHRLGRLEEARALADSARAGGVSAPRDQGGDA